jgi:hypothetical protein
MDRRRRGAALAIVVLAALGLPACAGARRACPPPRLASPCPSPAPAVRPVAAAAARGASADAGRADALGAARHGRGSGAIWSYLAATYDANRDGRVVRAEYPRTEATFERLDRDEDGALEASDFAGPTRMDVYVAALVLERIGALAAPPDAQELPDATTVRRAFLAADADDDGFVGEPELDRALALAQSTPIEGVLDLPGGVRPFPHLAAAIDADASGRLTLGEVWAWQSAAEAERAEAAARASAAGRSAGGGGRPPAPEVGAPAPDFDLPTRDGSATVRLSSFRGERAVALVFGSFTCPPFRHAAGAIRRAFEEHGDDVAFLFVYVREAHAIDGRAPMPAEDQPIVEEPRTPAERAAAATACAAALRFRFPTLVDGLDDAVNRAYSAAPVRLYVVARDGTVAYRSGPGPFGLDPEAFEAAVAEAAAR